jgi:formamidopyrimidine-DNA glycosylase
MPELPDVEVYRSALGARIIGAPLTGIVIANPFLLRTAVPPIDAAVGRSVIDVRRLGKRIVIDLDGNLHLVIHLMIAGRLRWITGTAKAPARITLARFTFPDGTLVFTEAGSKRRASLHLVEGSEALAAFDMGGLEVLEADLAAFSHRLAQENHTLKRALTDPHLFSGIGNAYSDEILHRAKLSPLALTQKLAPEAVAQLYSATREVLSEWRDRLLAEVGGGFPEKVTAFRPEMAVHGRFGKPCPVCAAPVQRIVYAENECNYCARCQTGDRILADRALSRLLHATFPRHLDDA